MPSRPGAGSSPPPGVRPRARSIASSVRSILGFLVFTAALIAILAALVLPMLVAPMVVSAVRDASPFGDQPLDIEVDVNAVGLARGFVNEIRVSGSGLETEDLAIGSLQVTLRGVRISDHYPFDEVTGRLGGVVVPWAGRVPISVRSVTLSGPSTDVVAQATLDPDQAMVLIRNAFADAGLEPTNVELVDGAVAVEIAGQRLELALIVVDGALVVPTPAGFSVEVLEPDADDAWRVLAVSVSPSGLRIDASLDPGGVPLGGD